MEKYMMMTFHTQLSHILMAQNLKGGMKWIKQTQKRQQEKIWPTIQLLLKHLILQGKKKKVKTMKKVN